MSQIVREGSVELQFEEKPTTYWKRNKKPTVNYYHDAPFAADRQLEDQRLSMEMNRNPQLHNPTKVDKPRSIQIAAKKGAARSVAMKANVLNKIVREASGVHNYTIVPPPRMKGSKSGILDTEEELLDPETNPYVKPYAKEAKSKPIICSFGHRPRSASRTFHPATMRFRLKHGEILPTTDSKKTNVGLPVAVLAKVLHAPVITDNPFDIASESVEGEEDSTIFDEDDHEQQPGKDYSDLFFSQDQQQDLLYNNTTNNTSNKSRLPPRRNKKATGKLSPLPHSLASVETGEHSWISSIEEAEKAKHHKKVSTTDLLPPVSYDGRPGWDEGFHHIHLTPKEMFEIKQSKINPKNTRPLKDLLSRFSQLTVSENQLHPFCQDRQTLDKLQQSGEQHHVPKSVAVKGQKLYHDPWDVEMRCIQSFYEAKQLEKQLSFHEKEYQDAVDTIPSVSYYPTTRLKAIKAGEPIDLDELRRSTSLPSLDEDQQIPHKSQKKKKKKKHKNAAATSAGDVFYESSNYRSLSSIPTAGSVFEPLHEVENEEELDEIEGELEGGNDRPSMHSETMKSNASSEFRNTAGTTTRMGTAELDSSSSRLFLNTPLTQEDYYDKLQREYPYWSELEGIYQYSLEQAKQGNRDALFELNIEQFMSHKELSRARRSSAIYENAPPSSATIPPRTSQTTLSAAIASEMTELNGKREISTV